MVSVCYMCEKDGVTTEHVPPQCLFPEDKDLPPGSHLRRNLITVPSCVDHNSKKSKDDEYLLYTLVMNLPTNGTAFQQFSTKIMRAMDRNPSLIQLLFAKTTDFFIENGATGERFKTIGYQIDTGRFYGALAKVARGLHFHHFKSQWLGQVDVYPEFLLSLDGPHSQQINNSNLKLARACDELFSTSAILGENPDVFCYRVHKDAQRHVLVMRLSFYGSGNVTVIFQGS